MATTHFEPIDARRCFPCWDEPALRATFSVTLTVPRDLVAISNMPEARVDLVPGGRKRVRFLPTPKMSTYLIAFCVGEYESLQGTTKDGTLVRVLCVPGMQTFSRTLDTNPSTRTHTHTQLGTTQGRS